MTKRKSAKTHHKHKQDVVPKHHIPQSKKILIIGVNETERDSLVEIALKGNKKYLPKLSFAKLPDFSGLEAKDAAKKRTEFYESFDKLIQRKRNFVISGSLTFKSGPGFSPLFTGDFFNRFSPDLTVILEIDTREAYMVPGYGIVRRKTDMSEVKMQQELNRYYATLLFSPMRIIKIKKDNVKKALKDLKELLITSLGDEHA